MEKVDYLKFLGGHPDSTVVEVSGGMGVSESAALSACKRLLRGKLGSSSGSPPRYRLTAEGEARLRVLSNQPSDSNPSEGADLAKRVGRLEVQFSALAGRVEASETGEEEIAEDLETLFGAVDRLLGSQAATDGTPQPEGSSGRVAQLLERAEKLTGHGAAPSEPTNAQEFYDALALLDETPWFRRASVRHELAALEAQLDAETVKDVHRLRELEQERHSWLSADDEGGERTEEIRSLREKLGLAPLANESEVSA